MEETLQFKKWLAQFCVDGVEPMGIVRAYLLWYFSTQRRSAENCGLVLDGKRIGKQDVYQYVMTHLAHAGEALPFVVKTDVMEWNLRSATIETDEMQGVSEDGDTDMIRFIRHMTAEQIERAPDKVDHPKLVKKKAGKFLRELMDEVLPELPESVKNWCSEIFAAKTNAARKYKDYELHVNKEFWRIYDPNRCDGNFGSCMAKSDWNGNWRFYFDCVDAHAAYITKKGSSKVVARCILFDDVVDDNGNHYRYAERQYSSGSSLTLMRVLIDLLKAGGYIDIHKRVGASCHDRREIDDAFSGASLRDRVFSTRCSLINGDNISYADTFEWYSPREHRVYNASTAGANTNLATTSSWFYNESSSGSRPNGLNPDYFHRCYTRQKLVQILYYSDTGSTAYKQGGTEFGDVVKIGTEYWYKGDCIEWVDGKWYPRGETVKSVIEHSNIPKVHMVVLACGDVCLKENAMNVDGKWYHKSSLMYIPCIDDYRVKELCTFIDDEPYPCGSDAVQKVGKNIKVLTKQQTWRNISHTEWDGDGFYDCKAYVDAVCPVWDKEAKKHVLGTEHIRPEYAFKNGGKWYSNEHCHFDMVNNKVVVKMPGRRKFPYVDVSGDGCEKMYICVPNENWEMFEKISNVLLSK